MSECERWNFLVLWFRTFYPRRISWRAKAPAGGLWNATNSLRRTIFLKKFIASFSWAVHRHWRRKNNKIAAEQPKHYVDQKCCDLLVLFLTTRKDCLGRRTERLAARNLSESSSLNEDLWLHLPARLSELLHERRCCDATKSASRQPPKIAKKMRSSAPNLCA